MLEDESDRPRPHAHRARGSARALRAARAARAFGAARALLASSVLALAVACARAPEVPLEPAELPAPRAGTELLGRELLPLLPARFLGAPPEIAGHVVLVRWWTDGCPFCERSLPALDALVNRERARGLVGVGVYHPKPPRAVDDAHVRAAADRLAWTGAVAIDADWSALKAAWLGGAEREATSVTFLLDRAGRVRWIHPGPELHPSDDEAHADCARDFAELERAVRALLDERP
ncbi:MAG: redoxin family protein [Planctomycetes bacterium]|nr:redoxin family protein [Planctomycetota bacterium]